jgi:hypothetical protein
MCEKGDAGGGAIRTGKSFYIIFHKNQKIDAVQFAHIIGEIP